MSKLLEQAIDKIRELPAGEQDVAASEILVLLADFATPEEYKAITKGQKAHELGEVVTLDQWQHDMELGSH